MSITKLKDRQLYTVCDPQKFDFASTAELEERMSALGQDRAISAVKLGINIKSKGYNLFCLGPEGTGKTSLVKRILEEAAKTRPTPRDWVYVYNFDEPYKPKSISFPAGTACEFAKDIDRLAEDFSVAIPAVLDSDEYKAGVSIIREKYKQKKEEYMRILQKKAKGKSVSLLHMQVGLVVAPVKNGEVLSPEAFDELPENEKQELINDLNLMQEEIEKAAKDLPEWEDRQRRESSLLREKFIKLAVKNPIDSLRQKYKGHREAIEFLKNIQNHIVGNIDEFLPEENAAPAEESDALSALLSRMNKQEEDKFAKFKVNVVVKNEPDSGAPIVHLDHPTQGNLVGPGRAHPAIRRPADRLYPDQGRRPTPRQRRLSSDRRPQAAGSALCLGFAETGPGLKNDQDRIAGRGNQFYHHFARSGADSPGRQSHPDRRRRAL